MNTENTSSSIQDEKSSKKMQALQPPRPTLGFTFQSFIFLGLSILCGYSTAQSDSLGLYYFSINYLENAEGHAYQGSQVWHIEHILFFLCLTLFIMSLINFFYAIAKKKIVSRIMNGLYLIVGLVLCATLLPIKLKNEFQVRYYDSASQSFYFLISAHSADFIEGNKGIFAGAREYEERITHTLSSLQGTTPEDKYFTFSCVTKKEKWLGNIATIEHFYPAEESPEDTFKKLKQHCKLIDESDVPVVPSVPPSTH